MRSLIVLAIGLTLAACGSEPKGSSDVGWQDFSLGTMPLHYAKKGERRYLVSVPRRYVDKLLSQPRVIDESGRIVANDIRFGVRYPSLKPTDNAWADGSIRVVIGNFDEEGISKSVDGSWPNHFSIYTRSLPNEHGLRVRQREDSYPFGDRLYFRVMPRLHVRIECKGDVHPADKWCIMDARRPGEPVLTTGFYSKQLPSWHDRLKRLQGLFRSEGRHTLGTVRKQS